MGPGMLVPVPVPESDLFSRARPCSMPELHPTGMPVPARCPYQCPRACPRARILRKCKVFCYENVKLNFEKNQNYQINYENSAENPLNIFAIN